MLPVMPMSLAHELEIARGAARAAGEAILAHYRADDAPPDDKDDGSPITVADREANDIILAQLTAAFPRDGILSEESADTEARLGCERVWIVDPLDGTRDFVARTGDFAVHVGLAIGGRAVLGAVYKPVGAVLYEAVAGGGAFRTAAGGPREPIRASTRADVDALRVGVTRTSVNPRLQAFLDSAGMADRVVHMGASIKFMAIAAGELDVSVCLRPVEKEWDTCAPEVILREAGATITDLAGAPFEYNKPDVLHRGGVLASNGPCHAALVDLVAAFGESGDA